MKTNRTIQSCGRAAGLSLPQPAGVFALRVLVAVLLVGSLCASCSKVGEGADPSEDMQIIPRVELPEVVLTSQGTRAPVDGSGSLPLYFARADKDASSGYGAYGSAALASTRAAGAADQKVSLSPVQYYIGGDNKTKMVGWHPESASFNGIQAQWMLDGSQDVMTASLQEGSVVNPMPAFTFRHRLSQLQFYPYAETQAIADKWGKVLKIEVLGQQNTAVFAMRDDATGNVTFAGDATASFAANVAAEGITMSVSSIDEKKNKVTMGGTVMIPPQVTNLTLTLAVTTQNQGVLQVTVNGKFEAGIAQAVYLRFPTLSSSLPIAPEISITDWTSVASRVVETDFVVDPDISLGDWTGNEEREFGVYPYVSQGKYVVSKDVLGSSAGPFHDFWAGATPSHIDTDAANAIAPKFEVAAADHSSRVYWENAIKVCPSGWRLPTVKELLLMYEVRYRLTGVSNFADLTYWASTASSDPVKWWCVFFAADPSQMTVFAQTNFPFSVRCIRDVK